MNIGDAIKRLAADSSAGLSINQLRVVVALERVVARLENEQRLREHLVFKGGFVLLKTIDSSRFTRDLDALALDIDQETVSKIALKALQYDLKDGVWFVDPHVEAIPDQGEYGGLRLNCAFQIGDTPPDPEKFRKLSRIHIDIGFGDVVPKETRRRPLDMPTALGSGAVSWHVYPLEFIFAEKLQTLLARGSANSRAKDVYDLVEIFPRCKDLAALSRAIRAVFLNRKTDLPDAPAAVIEQFDRTILSAAWGSVDVTGAAPRFEDYWSRLLNILKELKT